MITRYAYHDLSWIDILLPTAAEARLVMQEFAIDGRIAQEILGASPKPRAELYLNCIYLILHFPTLHTLHEKSAAQEVDFIITKNTLITVRYETIEAVDAFAKELEVHRILDKISMGGHAGVLFHLLITKLYRSLFHGLDVAENALDAIEQRVFEGHEREMVFDLSLVSRALIDFNRTISYHAEVLDALERIGTHFFDPPFEHTLHAISAEYRRVSDALDGKRQYLHELRATNDALLSSKQNEVMQIFTILAFVTFPLSLLANVFSISPLANHPNAFLYIIGILFVGSLTMLSYFRHRRWL